MKKTVYIFFTACLGALLSFIAHALIESLYLNWAESNDLTVAWHSLAGKSCALPPLLSISLLLAGVILGIWLGFTWWRLVYQQKKKGLFIKIKGN